MKKDTDLNPPVVVSEITIEKRRWSFYLCMAVVGLSAVFIGFAKTFIIPVANGNFKAPFSIHIHGAFAFSWVVLFLIQTSLIHFNKYNLHRKLGYLGLFISLGIMITMVPMGLYVVRRDLTNGLGEASYSSILGVIISGLLFLSIVLSGILKRNNAESHKRFMLLATIVVLWPAWFRFRHYFPNVPKPEIWFSLVLADSLIVIAWVWDKIKNGRIHPVLKYVGLFIILEQTFEVLVFDSASYRMVAKWIYEIF